MSLSEFQRAFADLIASPERSIRARVDPETAFADYVLLPRERLRLHGMVCSDGMSANCTLYRINRLIPVYSVLPNVCRLLGQRLGPELEAFAAASRHSTLQYRWEAWRFGEWLRQRILCGLLPGGALEDAILLELAIFDARTAAPDSEGRRRTLRLHHDPDALLGLRGDVTTPSSSEVDVVVDATGDELCIHRIER